MQAGKPKQPDLLERVIGVEHQVTALTSQMSTLTSAFHTLSDKIEQSHVRYSEAHKTNWTTIGGFLGLILVVVGMGASLWHSVLSDRIALVQKQAENSEALSHTRHEGQSELIRLNSDRQAALRAEFDSFQSTQVAHLREVETQIKSVSHLNNMRDNFQEILISELWQDMKGHPLQPMRVYPVTGDQGPE